MKSKNSFSRITIKKFFPICMNMFLYKPKQEPFKYTFVHIPKSGGTSIENAMSKNYKNYFHAYGGHRLRCSNANISIMVMREPVQRFLSMYKYWKNGSPMFRRDEAFKNKYKDYTVKDYIRLIKTNPKELNIGFTRHYHYYPSYYWINKTDYKKIIIIKYCDDLGAKFNRLLASLKIKNKNIPLLKENVSHAKKETVELDDEDMIFIKKYYRNDFKLWDDVNEAPELFGGVI